MFKTLFQQSIFEPAAAARQLIGLRLSTGEAWQVLVLAALLNAIMVAVMTLAFPPAQELPFLAILSPFFLTGLIFVIMGCTTAMLFWTGRFLNGTAEFSAILTLMAWLQLMRVAVQVGGFIMMLVLPGLANTPVFVANLYGVWILLNFLNQAQGYKSLGRSFSNLVLSFLALTVVLSVVFSIIGVSSSFG